MWELAAKTQTPICGKDFKTGQTMLKTVLSPMFKTRMLGLNGWFSTNILGNRDGKYSMIRVHSKQKKSLNFQL
jgi:Myo-inositol-1-phosphate synthase